jgi:LPXTG-site transpeptidase (sortase) family protein
MPPTESSVTRPPGAGRPQAEDPPPEEETGDMNLLSSSEAYTVTATVNNSEWGSASGGGVYQRGERVTLTATPGFIPGTETRYAFLGWYENGSQITRNAVYAFNAASNRTLEARFGLPQTGIQNMTPVFAVIGIAAGFLVIISKELILIAVKKTKRKFMFVTYIGVLTIFLSATVYGLDFYEDYKIYSNNLRVSQILREHIEERKDAVKETEPRAEHYGEESPGEYTDDSPGLIEIDGEFYFGIINIPALDLELPVNNEWNVAALEASPCRFLGDFTGSLIICAHNYRFHFANIAKLSAGDIIIITDAAGGEHIYAVELTEIISGTDVDGMINTRYDLTLFTCTPDGDARITVRCRKIPQ